MFARHHPLPRPAPPLRLHPRQRRRGSAIFIVMIMLAVMAVLGFSYLQWCRASYEAAKVTSSAPKVGAVARAATIRIGQMLSRDVVSSDSQFFQESPVAGPGSEPYDFPWTNRDAGDTRNQTTIFSLSDPASGALGVAVGGHRDDTWLASTAPDFSSSLSSPRWSHVSNLSGVFVAVPKATAGPSRKKPLEYVVDHSDAWHSDTGLTIAGSNSLADTSDNAFHNIGVDADGDGVLDSRWTWATIPQINGVSYLMAVRIIDLSALINVNAATSVTTDGDEGFHNAALPRGLFPSGVDLSRLLKRVQSSAWSGSWTDQWTDEMEDLYALREISGAPSGPLPALPLGLTDLSLYASPDDSVTPAPSYSAGSGAWVWLKSASRYGYAGGKCSIIDGFLLRYKNGLIHPQQHSPLESRMPQSLRRDSSSEQSFRNVDFSHIYPPASPGTPTDDQKRLAFFQGADNTFSAATSVASRTYPAIRHMLTDLSGAAPLAGNYGNLNSGAHTLRYDLQWQDYDHAMRTYRTSDRVSQMQQRLQRIFTMAGATGLPDANAYLGLNRTGDADLLERIAAEYALAISDYSDADSVPSSTTVGGVTCYGLELLPFLREAYCQVGYGNNDLLDGSGILGSDGQGDTWTFDGSSCAVAVEVGNPFDRPLAASLLNGRIAIAMVQNGVDVAGPWPLAGAPALPPRDPTGADTTSDQMVIYSNPASARNEPLGTLRSDLLSPSDGISVANGVATVAAPAGTLRFNADQPITVELRVLTAGGAWVCYDRLSVAGFQFPATVVHHPSLGGLAQTVLGENVHAQGSMVRDGRNIRYLSNTGKAAVDDPAIGGTQIVRLPDLLGFRRGGNSIETLGEDDKLVSGDSALDNFQIPLPNRTIFSVAELGQILMFGFSDQPNDDLPHRLSGGDGVTALAANRRFLEVSAAAAIPSSSGIPHAAMVFDQFTTISPRYDGIDQDNDDEDGNAATSADNSAEQLVPGLLNVNTAPLHILSLAAPLPEALGDIEPLMQQIVAYRDNAGASPTRWRQSNVSSAIRQDQGIASIGELLWINPGGGATNRDMQRLGHDGANQQGSVSDTYPMPEELAAPTAAVRTRAVDSPEEIMARFSFLAQSLSTRSDLYAAYILIQGYPAGDFRVGAIESLRVLAIFDRSALTSSASPTRIVAYYELPY